MYMSVIFASINKTSERINYYPTWVDRYNLWAFYRLFQHYVFNIKGNDYRMVVVIKFIPQFVLIRFIGTHAEYDKIDCSTI